MDKSALGRMSCNPAIGGLAKGQMVREIDVLGGSMARFADFSGIQFKVLNKTKGRAVWSTRAQVDKRVYDKRVLDAVSESRNMNSKARMDLLSRVSEDLRNSIVEVEDERRSLMALVGELNREITSAAQSAECTYEERRLLHHILHNKDYTIEGAAASLGLREAEVRLILESLQQRGLTR